MFLQANIFNIIGIVVFILVYFTNLFLHVPIIVVVLLSMLSIYAYQFFFEYQRITLMIGRYIKSKDMEYKDLDVSQIQMYLSSPLIGFGIALDSLLTGFMGGIMCKYNFLYFVFFLLVKYFLIALIKLPIPYKIVFKIISNTLSVSGKEIMLSAGGFKLFMEIYSIFKKMPHNKEYENWLYQNMPKS